MSDIIYTPPATGGGANVNPTNTYMPVNIGGSFVDSIIQCIPNTFAQSMRGASGFGFGTYVSGTSCQSWLGDWNNQIDGVYIEVKNDAISSRIFTANRGFYLDYVINRYIFGDWANVYNGVNLNIDDTNRQVGFTDNNFIDGLFLNYASSTFQFGKITTNSLFSIDATNQYAQITLASIQYMVLDQLNGNYLFGDYAGGQGLKWDNSNNEFVLLQQGFEYIVVGNNTTYFGQRSNFSYKIDYSTSILSMGDNAYTINETLFVVDMIQDIICTQTLSSRKGLLIDFPNKKYSLGDFNNVNNKTYLYIDDGNNLIYFNTENLVFNGSALQSNTASGNSGEHLVITLNGVQYKIKLENP